MGRLERAGAPAAAAAFASAAVQHVDAAVGGGGAAAPGEAPRREGRLWANLFEYALQGGAFEVRRRPAVGTVTDGSWWSVCTGPAAAAQCMHVQLVGAWCRWGQTKSVHD